MKNQWMAYMAGFFMACLSFLVNKALLKIFGPKIIISYSPLVEESTKTLFAYCIGADILLTHVAFGAVEASYDFYHSKNFRWQAAMLSIVAHSLFGIITVITYQLSDSILIGLLLGFTAHWLGNILLVNLSN